jgi:hypothetical protein
MLRSASLLVVVVASFGCSISTGGLFGGAGGGDAAPASTGPGAGGSRGGAVGSSSRGAGGSMGHGGGDVSVGVAAGGGSQGGASASGGGGGGGHGPDCDALLQDVNDALAKAQACQQPFIGQPTPCKAVEMGTCCPVVVAFGDSTETHDYLEALAIYENAGCHAECPQHTCDQQPKGTCNAPIGGSGACVTN